MYKNANKVLTIILIANIIFGCNQGTDPPVTTTEDKMYVYSNSGKTFYLVDYETYDVVKEIKLDVPDTVSCGGMAVTTNRDYLFFGAQGQFPNPPSGFAIYNIEKEKLENLFFTDMNYGIGYFITAENVSEPGLIYTHFRDYGTYSIDLFAQKIIELISDEHDFSLDKRIFHSSDGNWTVIKKNWEAIGYTELEFYTVDSQLHSLQFTLNKENQDSLRVYDWQFLKDKKLAIIYLPGPTRENQICFGYYDLVTKQLYRSSLKFPWSLSGYYLGYSSTRNEVYAIGGSGEYYIIDCSSYSIKDTIELSVKGEQSPIVITPDEKIAFAAFPSSNLIYVIDLEKREVKKTISVTEPYNMIIP